MSYNVQFSNFLTNEYQEIASKILDLIYIGDFIYAIEIKDSYESRTDITQVDRLSLSLLESIILNKLGNIKEALDLIDHVLSESPIPLLSVDAYLLKAEIMKEIGRIDDSLDAVERGEAILTRFVPKEVSEVTERLATILQLKGMVLKELGTPINLDLALIYFLRSAELFTKSGNKLDIAVSLKNIGEIHNRKNDLDLAYDYYLRSQEIYADIGSTIDVAVSLCNLANIHRLKGELSQTLTLLRRGLHLRKKVTSP